MALNFPRAAILDFMTCYGCRYCLEAEDLLCETIGATITLHKFQNGGAGEI